MTEDEIALLQLPTSSYALLMNHDCILCSSSGGELVWRDSVCRVVQVDGPEQTSFPGFCRVIWNHHRTEMTELTQGQSQHLMSVVFAVERVLRRLLQPDKINLASLGNVVPHLHWHVIPRWHDDSHFPASIWSTPSKITGVRDSPNGTADHSHDSDPAQTRLTVSCASLSAALALELEEIKVTAL